MKMWKIARARIEDTPTHHAEVLENTDEKRIQ
jgi:hypothetical protein